MRERFQAVLQKYSTTVVSVLWVLFVLLLPMTSLPLVARLVGGQMVAIPSGLIILAIVLVWLLPKIFNGMKIPKHTLPLLLFIFISLVATILGYWRDIPPFKGINPLKENLESIITLVMGASCYLVTMLWLRGTDSEKKVNRTLRLITYAGIVVMGEAFLEVVLWRTYGTWPPMYRQIHNLFSTGTLFRDRVVAFTFEPSWLAHQLNLLFLPYWLASAVTRTTAFKRRLWKFQVEDICLVLGAAVLFFTLSRLGYISFLFMLGVIFLRGSGWLTGKAQVWIEERNQKYRERSAQRMLKAGLYALVALMYIGLFIAAAFIFSKLDHRSQEIFDFSNFNIMRYAEMLSFGARITYWWGGWNIFSQFPILGVGLGNAGFYFQDALPAYAWRLIEIREWVFHSNILLNIKSLWFRILAETGIAGFSAFIAFLVVVYSMVRVLMKRTERFARFIGWMGLFALTALMIEELSLDTFALPYFWVTFGIVAAVYESDSNKQMSV